MRRPAVDSRSEGGPGRPGATVVSVVGTAALALMGTGAPATADASEPPDGLVAMDPEFEESAPFRDGHWIGSLSAAGPVSVEFDEAAISMHTAMSGMFDVVVAEDVVSGGSWDLTGSSDGVVSAPFGTGSIRNDYHGSGPVEGDEGALVLGGGVDTTWTMDFGGGSDVSQDPLQLGPFEVAVTHANCERLVGDWEAAFAAEIAAAGGWRSSLGGSFEATHSEEPPDDDLLERIYELGDEYNAWVDDVRAGVYADLEAESTSLEAAAIAPMLDLVEGFYDVERQLADLGDDEACLFGRELGQFSFLLTAGLQDLAWWLLEVVDDWQPSDLELLGRGLLAVGGIGDGAIRRERAEQLEQRWVERATERFEDAVFDDQPPACTPQNPCMDPTDELLAMAVFGAQMGFTFEIAGVTVDPDTMRSMLSEWEDE